MTVATVKIWNQVLRKGKVEKLSTEMVLPCGDSMIAHALDELEIEGVGENGWMEVKWEEPYNQVISMIFSERDINHLFEVNHLAQCLAIMSKTDFVRFQVLCRDYLDDGYSLAKELDPLDMNYQNIINMTHNVSGDIKVLEGIGTNEALGRYCISNHLVPGFENLNSTVLEYLNYARIGGLYDNELGGSFKDGCYVYDLPARAELKLPYDGKSLLIEPPAPPGPEEDAEQTGGIKMGGM